MTNPAPIAPLRVAPDDFAALGANDLTQAEFDSLVVIWPAAYVAVGLLLDDILEERLHPSTSVGDMPLTSLVLEYVNA